MLKLICLFFPAVCSVGLFERLRKTDLKFKNMLYAFCFNAVLCNSAVLFFKEFITLTSQEPLNAAFYDITPSVAIRYLAIALPAALIVGILEALLLGKINTSVKTDGNGDTDDDKSNGK